MPTGVPTTHFCNEQHRYQTDSTCLEHKAAPCVRCSEELLDVPFTQSLVQRNWFVESLITLYFTFIFRPLTVRTTSLRRTSSMSAGLLCLISTTLHNPLKSFSIIKPNPSSECSEPYSHEKSQNPCEQWQQ
mmetsp:Transcript_29125/g.76412  ORF Transcript_29125/g.76412 Transcript_29125/m.76412 type:complete len:131 (-) Transcript_29125:203-595(-)